VLREDQDTLIKDNMRQQADQGGRTERTAGCESHCGGMGEKRNGGFCSNRSAFIQEIEARIWS
jgi:hypothetical protein